MDILKKYEDIALSNFDIMKLLNGNTNIILYPNLHKYASINEMIKPYGSCIILFENAPRYGHWCCLFKVNEYELEFFNPYGGFPDDSLQHISTNFRKKTNQLKPLLSILMINSPYKLSYNEFAFQKLDKNIKTCGRHCVVRLKNRNLSLYEYYDYLNKLSNETGYNFDEIVTLMTI